MTAILFNALLPVAWICIISILALGVLGWLEVKRNQRLLIPRLLAILLAIVSLACLALNPVRAVKKTSDILVLTQGFDKKILDSLLNENPKGQVYKLSGVAGDNKATEIENYRNLSEFKGNLYFLGQGIPSYMLDYADTLSIQFYPSPIPDGFIRINSDKVYTANQPSTIEGVFKSVIDNTIKLTGPGLTEDSIQFRTKASQPFSLTFTPKVAGLYLYTLTASDSSGKVLYTEQIPIQVRDQKKLSILVLSDYPSAEIRFLKNFLETQNHKLTLRYKVSKDRYRTEFINTVHKPVGKLNESLLNSFDLVLTDASSLPSLSGGEIQALKEAQRLGLGVLTLLNTSALSGQVKDFLDFKLHPVKTDSAQLFIKKQKVRIPATSASVSSEKKIFTVYNEPGGRIVSGYHATGLGKSGFQLLTNTYSLQLAGEKEAYAEVWSRLIETIARKEIRKYDLSFVSQFPYYEDEPVEFKIIGSGEKPTVILDSVEISLAENPLIENVWYGKIWEHAGWHSLLIKQDSSQHNFFISPNEAWGRLRILNQQQALKKLLSQKIKPTMQVTHRPVSLFIFLIVFLLSAGFLWLAPKL